MTERRRVGLAVLAGVAVALGVAAFAVDRWAPPQHLPWKPLTLDQPIGLATHWKVLRLEPERCRAVLAEGGVAFRPSPPTREGGYCSIEGAGRIVSGLPTLRPSVPVMTCREAVGLAIWSRQVVEPAAREILGQRVTGIDHFGTYACRQVRGGGGSGPSQHATANAIDFAGVRLADGRRVSVLAHYDGGGPRQRFLRRLHDGGCRVFSSVLGPDYNAAHRDHYHLDMGAWGMCR